ncbi:MAG: TVP38/TMEM64 family protein [Gammaproteobacteria bacterium]|nr:TVP38/TMEM64 family protein [Gammaproteobacteria bacterium]
MKRFLPIAILGIVAAIIFSFDLHTYLSYESLREHRETLTEFVAQRFALAAVTFVLIYAISTALSLPGGAILSITGGFLFGGITGGLLVVVGATIGATLVFLAAKTVLGDSLRTRAGPWLKKMEEGFKENAFNYLLVLRLIPLFPFFVVNLVPAFLGVPLGVYIIGTFIGIIPATFVFTFAGAGIGAVLDSGEGFSVSAILTPQIIVALVGLAVLAVLPVIYKKIMARKA